MKLTVFAFSAILLLQVSCSSGTSSGFALPEEWTKDFAIDLYYGGGMQDKSTSVTFTYDSSKYEDRVGTEKKITAFALTDANRKEILKKLHDLKVDKLRTRETSITMDKESTRMCFEYKTEFCLTDGASSELHNDDVKNFSEAYQYLTNFALRK